MNQFIFFVAFLICIVFVIAVAAYAVATGLIVPVTIGFIIAWAAKKVLG